MKIIKIWGGVGNQLFQYMLYRRLLEEGEEVYGDISWFSNVNRRFYYPFQLERLGLEVKILEKENKLFHSDFELELLRLSQNKRNAVSFIFRCAYYISRAFRQKMSVVNENDLYEYNDSIFEKTTPLYCVGFWQNNLYYQNCLNKVVKEIRLDQLVLSAESKIVEELIKKSKNSVCIHIRRNDYSFENFDEICSQAYYSNAISYIRNIVENPVFFVFSNKIEKAKSVLNDNPEVVFVDINDRMNGLEDLKLMSECNHHILSNSTFSWWGTVINSNYDSINIMPKKWREVEPAINLLCEGWIEI